MARVAWRHQTREPSDWLYWWDCMPQIGLTCYPESSFGRKKPCCARLAPFGLRNEALDVRWAIGTRRKIRQRINRIREDTCGIGAVVLNWGIVSRLVFVRILP